MRPARHPYLAILATGLVVTVVADWAISARPPVPDVGVSALAAPASVRLGSSATVGFTIRNAGPVAANVVTVTVTAPSGVTVEALSASAGRCTTSSCALGTIQPKATRRIQVTFKPSAVGTWAVTARVSSKTKDRKPANNKTVARARVVGDDTVTGSGSRSFRVSAPPVLVEVDAKSGPRGEDPSGTFLTRYPVGAWLQSGVELRGEVVCLTVAGNRATVGGLVQQSSDTRYPAGTNVLLVLTDNGSPGAGRDTQVTYFGTDVNARVCPSPYEGAGQEVALSDGDFTIHDEQP